MGAQAQQLIRGLRPPLPAGQELLVDQADGHLRGAVHVEILPDGDVEVRAMAVSLPVRATGVGSALMSAVITHRRVVGRLVFADVHEGNGASRALLARHGFGFAEGRAPGWLLATRLP